MSGSHPSPRRHWPRRAVITVLVLANVVVLGGWWYLRHLTQMVEAEIVRDDAVVAELTPVGTAPKAAPGEEPPGEPPIVFLIIGSDSRENLPDELGITGSFAGQRADVIMLMQVFPSEARAQMLSIPRDLKTTIEGHGTQKINAAFAYGGAALMVATVRDDTGIAINHYAEIDFVGFASLVDELGGVEMTFPYPARDSKSGLSVEAGTHVLDGKSALAFARSRTYQELRDGKWVSVDASDIGRTRRQQQLIFAILSELKRPSTITDAGPIIASFARHVTVDGSLESGAMLELAWAMRSFDSSKVEAATLPTTSATIDGLSYQLPKEPEASQMLEAFMAGAPLTLAGAEPARVQVLNGDGASGLASVWSDRLTEQGFVVVFVGDAGSFGATETTITASLANLAQAREVAAALGFGTVTAGTTPESVDVIVVLGSDAAAA